MNLEKLWQCWTDSSLFSGVVSIMDSRGTVFERCSGFRNQGEGLLNNRDTAFGIASGTKLFTGLAVCKLMDAGKLSLTDRIWEILPHDLGRIDRRVTVFHLLTHSSGIGDYIDEEAPDSVEQMQDLYARYPVYLWENLGYYLQMITPLPSKFEPGARFGYSNAGFVLLGLVVEALSGKSYQDFVTDEIIRPLGLCHTGFYRMDCLPANTALGYLGDPPSCRTNIYHIPIVGGADGGLFTCAQDLDQLWRALFAGRVLSPQALDAFTKLQIQRNPEKSYGLGVYRLEWNQEIAYYGVGGDFGVDFFTAYFPKQGLTASALGNTELNTYPLLEALFEVLLK